MQNFTRCLWFDNEGEDAANFYASTFKNAKVNQICHYSDAGADTHGQPAGKVMTVAFEISGTEFLALNGGPQFKINPAISFFVTCKTEADVEDLFNKLSAGGEVMMPLSEYPFSKKFGWVQDKFGVSWQLNLGDGDQKISTALMFTGENLGRAEEAIKFYTNHFANSQIVHVEKYGAGEPGPEGTVKFALFKLNGEEFMAMDSAAPHQFNFNMAISIIANCENQAEIDEFWNKLTQGGEPGHCGWLVDMFGVSWQVTPAVMRKFLEDDGPKTARVMAAIMPMHKLDLAALEKAYTS